MAKLPATGDLMGRAVEEWIGKTPDSKPPPHVKTRIFLRHEGKCHLSGRKILPGEPWDLEHVKALHKGGENRESNMAPALRLKHREKTAEENKEKAKVERMRAKHLGVYEKPKRRFGQ